ncbi:MAG: T9SS type A sorting domain-containing protein [Candidatus Cloacimonadales bacterium]
MKIMRLLIMLIFIFSSLYAVVIQVPHGSSIQDAIDNANEHDIIELTGSSYSLSQPLQISSTNHLTIVSQRNSIYPFGDVFLDINNCILTGSYNHIPLSSHTTVSYSNIQGGYNGTGTNNINLDPQFEDPGNSTDYPETFGYGLTWGSPCIDAGDPNSPLDPDDTIADMGCYYYHQIVDNRNFSGSEWNWISFPRLDVDASGNQLSGEVLSDLQPQLPSSIEIDDQEDIGQTYNGTNWFPPNYTFDRVSGYKINCPYVTDLTLDVPGVRIEEDTPITLLTTQENWVGYFCENSSSPERALESIWDDFKMVRHKDWSYYRTQPGGTVYKLLTSSTVRPGFKYGEMAIIKMFRQQDLVWNTDNTIVLSHPESQAFTYEEKADYTPIHVELESGTDVLEVGVFVNNECKGFGIVTEDEAMIRAYLDDTRNVGGEIEFVYYNGGRSQNKVSSYSVYDRDLGAMVERKIDSRENRDFYNVSLRKDGSSEMGPKPKLSMSAYPNPFNPTTNISFYVSETEEARVEIFNIKGQKVKTLFNGVAHSGKNLLVWNGVDDSNQAVGSGIYFCRISVAKEKTSKKLMLLK